MKHRAIAGAADVTAYALLAGLTGAVGVVHLWRWLRYRVTGEYPQG